MKDSALTRWFARMSDRERTLVVGGGGLVLIALIVLTATLVSRKVITLEEQVAADDASLTEIRDLAPAYLKNRREETAIDEQLKRASGSSLQSLLLGIAKDVKFTRRYTEGGTQEARLSDYVKFNNETEVLADLTKKRGKRKKKKKKKKGVKDVEQQVFLRTIEVIFDRVPDTPLYTFMQRVETLDDALFATSVDISRESPNHEHFRAKMRIGQFRYGRGEGG